MSDTTDELIDRLDDMYLERAQTVGGYPEHVTMIGSYLVIAGVDGENGAYLEWYTEKAAAKWYKDAKKMVAETIQDDDPIDWHDALMETEPKTECRMKN